MINTDQSDHTVTWPPSATTVIWPSPAKLNLFLHITGRRHDGYHLLQTVFQILDYGDEMAFVPRTDRTIRLVNPIDGVAAQQNLIWQAADLLQHQAKGQSRGADLTGLDIYLKKKLPMGGGLGGGSSNAATTLVALNKLWQLQYSPEQLAEFGLKLGADVPVFVMGHSAWGEGIGEILQPLSLPERWYVVIHPGVHVSTEALFKHSQLTRDCSPITIRGFCSGSATRNVFEPLVCEQQPAIKDVLKLLSDCAGQWLGSGSDTSGIKPRLTGTGSCVFLECEEQVQAQSVLNAVVNASGMSITGFIARGANESPLIQMI